MAPYPLALRGFEWSTPRRLSPACVCYVVTFNRVSELPNHPAICCWVPKFRQEVVRGVLFQDVDQLVRSLVPHYKVPDVSGGDRLVNGELMIPVKVSLAMGVSPCAAVPISSVELSEQA